MANIYEQFLLNNGLYDEVILDCAHETEFIDLVSGNVKLDCYCPHCKTNRVFSIKPQYVGKNELAYELRKCATQARIVATPCPGVPPQPVKSIFEDDFIRQLLRCFTLTYVCSMDNSHTLDFAFKMLDGKLTKIGQYPSIADLSFPELDKYKKVLSPVDRKEFGRAIGLYASGIGAGSYVYLRRILERLLIQAKENAGSAIDTDAFAMAKVKDKITMLKNYLPDLLTSNAAIYGILSKGIHELTEEECLAYFPIVKDCLFMILQQWEEMRKKQENEKSISAALAKIVSSIK